MRNDNLRRILLDWNFQWKVSETHHCPQWNVLSLGLRPWIALSFIFQHSWFDNLAHISVESGRHFHLGCKSRPLRKICIVKDQEPHRRQKANVSVPGDRSQPAASANKPGFQIIFLHVVLNSIPNFYQNQIPSISWLICNFPVLLRLRQCVNKKHGASGCLIHVYILLLA